VADKWSSSSALFLSDRARATAKAADFVMSGSLRGGLLFAPTLGLVMRGGGTTCAFTAVAFTAVIFGGALGFKVCGGGTCRQGGIVAAPIAGGGTIFAGIFFGLISMSLHGNAATKSLKRREAETIMI
jgi:hypothetical protein